MESRGMADGAGGGNASARLPGRSRGLTCPRPLAIVLLVGQVRVSRGFSSSPHHGAHSVELLTMRLFGLGCPFFLVHCTTIFRSRHLTEQRLLFIH